MYPVNTNSLRVTSYFGPRTYTYQGKQVSDYHKGIDLVGGSEIIAFADGVVTSICNKGEQYGTGCYVRLKHSNGYQTLYYHLKSGSVCVSVGQSVKKGQKLGIMGTTGQSTGVHLHFQIDKGSSSSAINPYDYVFNGKNFISDSLSNTTIDTNKSIDELAREVIAGKYGNGDTRRNALGSKYSEVQARVNEILNSNSQPSKPVEQSKPNVDILILVKKTIRGDFGNGQTRRNNLGSNYDEVQRQVNLNYNHGTTNWDNIRLY